MIDFSVIEKFGFPVGMVVIFSSLFIWVLRITITHFLDTIKELTEERKSSNKDFLESITKLNDSIAHNNLMTESISIRTDQILRVVHGG